MKDETRITAEGRGGSHGIVNMPVYRASTVLFPTVADLAGLSDLSRESK